MNKTRHNELKQEIKVFIEANLKPKRLAHTYSVAQEAMKLADRFGQEDEKAELMEKAELASLFHDMYKSTPVETLNEYIKEFGLPNNLIDNPNLAHGKVAAAAMERDYQIDDRELIDAVAYHTTGRAGMNKLEKIVFLADAIEAGRDYPTVDITRKIALTDLDKACINCLERTIEFLESNGADIDMDTINARKDLKENLEL